VLEAAGVAGRPIWQVDPAATARAIERFPVVRRATVSRIWPNQVAIMIEERVPSAVWRSAAAEVVVDDDGVVLDAPVMGGLVSVIHTDGRDPLAPGDRVDGDAVRLAMTIGAVLPVETGQRVARIEYSSSGGLDVVTDRGQRLRLGDGQNLDYKLNLWRAITAQARAERITPTEVDLRFGRWAAVR
jgi:cell division protein FtsQ